MDGPTAKQAIEHNFVSGFLAHPVDTVVRTCVALRDLGYFDFSVLYRQFYDPTAALLQPVTVVYYVLFGALVYVAHRSSWPSRPTLPDYLLPMKTVRSQSFRLDVQWFLLTLLKFMSAATAVLGLVLFLRFASNYLDTLDYSNWYVLRTVRGRFFSRLPLAVRDVVLFFSVIVTVDFLEYWYHRLLHKSDLLWNFHKIHHYPQQITLLANWRGHPVEQIAGDFVNKLGLTISIALWTPLYSPQDIRGYDEFFAMQLPVLWAVIAVQHFFHSFNHSTIYIRFGSVLDKVFYAPALHMVHHARDFPNKNFANVFSVWDRVFGTLYEPKNIAEHYAISQRLGVSDMKDDEYKTVVHAIVVPFLDCLPRWASLRKMKVAPRD